MKFAAITCTGGRHELFRLTQRWIERQMRLPDLWIVVTDNGDVIDKLPPWATFAQVPPRPASWDFPGYPIPAWSLSCALQMVPAGYAAIPMEDDDWFSKVHCSTIMSKLEQGHMISYGDEVYYFHVPAQRWQFRKGEHSTEGCIGLHPDAIERWRLSLPSDPRWNPADGVYRGFTKVDIKGVGYGLPGRHGTTNRHNPKHKKGMIMRPDPHHLRFKKAVGAVDAQCYINLCR